MCSGGAYTYPSTAVVVVVAATAAVVVCAKHDFTVSAVVVSARSSRKRSRSTDAALSRCTN